MTPLPTKKDIDLVRQAGFRPTVVACLIYKRKVLLVYNKKYRHWLMPQGGVENHEELKEALFREVKEELGENFSLQLRLVEPILLTEDELDFKENDFNARDLFTDNGQAIEIIGKHYYFLVAQIENASFDEKKSEFDRVIWANFKKAQKIIESVYLQNKRSILQKSIDVLKEQGLIE